jgi:hypothetical protein
MTVLTKNPSSGSGWTNSGNILTQNDVYATAVAHIFSFSDPPTPSPTLFAGFDFSSIPINSTINQVRFRYRGYYTAGGGSTADWYTGTSLNGAPVDVFNGVGLSLNVSAWTGWLVSQHVWAAADLLGPNFNVYLWAQEISDDDDEYLYVDTIECEVTYTTFVVAAQGVPSDLGLPQSTRGLIWSATAQGGALTPLTRGMVQVPGAQQVTSRTHKFNRRFFGNFDRGFN